MRRGEGVRDIAARPDQESTMARTKITASGNRPECPARSVARDPAAWGWLVVALLALLPLGGALAQHERRRTNEVAGPPSNAPERAVERLTPTGTPAAADSARTEPAKAGTGSATGRR
jgi:hypothetical protein